MATVNIQKEINGQQQISLSEKVGQAAAQALQVNPEPTTYHKTVLDFIKHKKEKQELAKYLNSIGVKTSTIHEIIKPGGRYDTTYTSFWNNYDRLCAEEIKEALYRGDEKKVEQYLRLIEENLEFIKKAGITERDVFEALRKTEDGKKMSDAQLRKLITVAVRVGFDRITALEMLREWGVVPPTLLQTPQKATQAQMINAIHQSTEAIRKLTSDQIDKKLEKIEDGKLERSERLLREECGSGKTELGKLIKDEAKKKADGSGEVEKLTEKVIKEMAKLIAMVAEQTTIPPEKIVRALNGKAKNATVLRNSTVTVIMQKPTTILSDN